jgi:hypothetical protein
MWLTLKAQIKGIFLEYKSNPSPIRCLLELLVQVGEVKLLLFSNFALLSASAAGSTKRKCTWESADL